MNKPNYPKAERKLATLDEARGRYSLSRKVLLEIATDADAVRRFGRAVRIDVPTMDKAIESYR